MTPSLARPPRRALLGMAVLATGLWTGALAPHAAQAMLASCATDPKLKLSNGDEVKITATIGAERSSITNIVYTVHVPAGLAVSRIIYTGGLAGKETVNVYADNAPSTYITATTVHTTHTGGVSVTATTVVDASGKEQVRAVSGYDNTDLTAQINMSGA